MEEDIIKAQRIISISIGEILTEAGGKETILNLVIELDDKSSLVLDYERSRNFKIGDEIVIKINNSEIL